MPDIKGLLQKLRKVVVGDSSDDLRKVALTVNSLKTKSINGHVTNFSDLIKAIVDTENNKATENEFLKILADFGLSIPQGEETNRVSRYKEYENIVEKIPYLKRGLKILTQNILTPEDYTNDVLFVSTDLSSQKAKVFKQAIENVLQTYNLQDQAQEIVYNTLLFGDYFVEIVPVDTTLKQYQLLEHGFYRYTTKISLSGNEINLVIESQTDIKDKKKETDKVFLVFHQPHTVIRLGDDNTELGYLVVVGADITKLTTSYTSLDSLQQNNLDKVVSAIVQRIRASSKVKEVIKKNDDFKEILLRLILSSKEVLRDIKVRYVPPELMQHFKLKHGGVTKHKPYGTSVLYGTEFLAKIIIAIQGSIMVQRLTRSVDRQLIYVEIGSSRDVKTYIEEVRRALQRRRFTVDGVKVDEIPSQISSYEYLYIPQKDGKRFVEFDQWSQPGDVASRVDDLKALRDALVASLEIPAAYLGIEENIEARATLVEQNIVFATTVMGYQKEFSKLFKDLTLKILNITYTGDVYDFDIYMQKPLSLLAERTANYFDNVSRIVETGKSLGIPPTYFIKKFFNLDESELENLQVEEGLKKIIQNKPNQEEGGFGGGGGFEEFGGGEEGEVTF